MLIFNSRNHLFEGNWKDTNTQSIHQICQWNNDYIIEPSINPVVSTKISTINMLHIPKLHQCGNNDAEYTEDRQSPIPKYQLTWNENNAEWIREQELRYILPHLYPYTTYATPIISAQAITYQDIKSCMLSLKQINNNLKLAINFISSQSQIHNK